MKLRPGRRVILTDPDNFPTDIYIAQGIAAMLGDVTVTDDSTISAYNVATNGVSIPGL